MLVDWGPSQIYPLTQQIPASASPVTSHLLLYLHTKNNHTLRNKSMGISVLKGD